MLLYLILIFFLLFFCWILFLPIRLVINTEDEQFYIKQSGTFKVTFKLDELELVYLRVRLFYISFSLYPIRSILNDAKPADKKKRKKRNLSIRTIHLLFKIIKNNLSTYKVKKLIVNIDTGSVITNSYLFPVGEIIGGKDIRLSINNSNDYNLEVLIENTLFMMVVVTIKSLIKHHIHK